MIHLCGRFLLSVTTPTSSSAPNSALPSLNTPSSSEAIYNVLQFFCEPAEEHAERIGWRLSQTSRWRMVLTYFLRQPNGRQNFSETLAEIQHKPLGEVLVGKARDSFYDHMTRGYAGDFLYQDEYTLAYVMGMLAVHWDEQQTLLVPTVLDNGYGFMRYMGALLSEGVNALRGAYSAEQWKDVKRDRALQGLPNSSNPVFGYGLAAGGRFVPQPGEWRIVRYTFVSYLVFGDVKAVASHLDEIGLVTKQGKPWIGQRRQDGDAVRAILFRNQPTYLGKIAYQRMWLPGIHVPLISEALARAVLDVKRGERQAEIISGSQVRGSKLWEAENEQIARIATTGTTEPVALQWHVVTEQDLVDVSTAFAAGRLRLAD